MFNFLVFSIFNFRVPGGNEQSFAQAVKAPDSVGSYPYPLTVPYLRCLDEVHSH